MRWPWRRRRPEPAPNPLAVAVGELGMAGVYLGSARTPEQKRAELRRQLRLLYPDAEIIEIDPKKSTTSFEPWRPMCD